jgi:hypothetical protein
MGEVINKKLKAKVVHKHETAAGWEKSSYVPDVGEIVFYDPDETYNYTRQKNGDGINTVTDLPFAVENVDLTGYATEDYVDNLYEFANTHVGLHHLVDIGEAGMTFKELLRYYIKRSGKTDADIYHAAFVSRDKFNHIINGRKGKKVKKINEAIKKPSGSFKFLICFKQAPKTAEQTRFCNKIYKNNPKALSFKNVPILKQPFIKNVDKNG